MSDVNQMKQQIKEMIVERLFLSVEPSEISDDENLMETYDIDSVNLFEIVVGLEEVFGITLDDADFTVDTFATVANIAAYVEQKCD